MRWILGHEKRRWRNFLLSPIIQLRIIFQIIVVSAVFMVGILAYTYFAWNDILLLIIEMTDIPREVTGFFTDKFLYFFATFALILLIQFTIVTVLLIMHTHRFVGASFAIRRFVRDCLRKNKFDEKVILRKHDYLFDVAEEVNRLSEDLEAKSKK